MATASPEHLTPERRGAPTQVTEELAFWSTTLFVGMLAAILAMVLATRRHRRPLHTPHPRGGCFAAKPAQSRATLSVWEIPTLPATSRRVADWLNFELNNHHDFTQSVIARFGVTKQ